MCGKKRFDRYEDEPLWQSDIGIILRGRLSETFTVCPDCRGKYTFKDMIGKHLDKMTSRILKEVVKNG